MRWLFDTTRAAALAVVAGGLAIPNNNNKKNNGGTRSWRGNLGSIPPPTMVTWLVDGNNLSCSREVPNERETILRELSKIASPRASTITGSPTGSGSDCDCDTASRDNQSDSDIQDDEPSKLHHPISNIVVVFDGNEDETSDTTVVETDKWLEWTVTDGRDRLKDRADDWIVDRAIPHLRQFIDERLSQGKGTTRVNLISADKDLRKRVGSTRILHGGSFVHPPKFWKDYLPVLQEQQRKQQQQQREEGA
jgi:hypothetical protein